MESRDQLVSVWGRLGAEPSGGDGVDYLWAGSPFGLANAITLSAQDIPAEDLSEQLVRAAAFLREQSEGGYLWIFDDLLSPRARQELDERAAATGLEIAFTGYGMDGETTVDQPHHPDLEFRRVETEDDLRTYGEINALAYDAPASVGQQAFTGSPLLLDDAYAVIGYRDGRPVTCAAAVSSGDVLVVAFVATLAEESRRGYGEAVTRQAIFGAGPHRRVLAHSTAEGRPVLERIGLRATSTIRFLQPTFALDDLGA
ncbi:hypothetical protein OWR29_35300 [Actinoplanes sp. Pm04-4]|uniref:N-acetyltransferase domain-containing protein n=1 Tax=Paractinoplanes pyxinae TaxID=2997416 RepID=A0ABT4BBB2_9ACTN|nr:hypothetical protein [Actinoplanes pyxinae]MCY1143292.1 hypothetical protein [Actinoplanes pyxinae]